RRAAMRPRRSRRRPAPIRSRARSITAQERQKRLYYASFGGTPDSNLLIMLPLMKAGEKGIDLLPGGHAGLEKLTDLKISNGKETKTVTCYAITGFRLSPFPIWMDGTKFFGVVGGIDLLPPGWAEQGPTLVKAQDEALAKRAPELVARIAKTPPAPIA